MSTASLALQYPDWQSGRIRLLAVTKNWEALQAFKRAVLEEAGVNALLTEVPILKIEVAGELAKLTKLLDALIPEAEDA